jgi:hypothetical protein
LLDRSFGKTTIGVEGPNIDAEDRQATARRMWAALLVDAVRRYHGQAVVAVTYKSTEAYIRKALYVPPWLTVAHFGDIAGTDQWKDVRALYMVGRPLPRAAELADIAGALTGEYVEQRKYVEVEMPIFIYPDAQGYTSVHVKQWRHPHPVAERLRQKACEGALMQVIGRVRGMWRTPANPVDINIWTDVPLQDQADETACDINKDVEPVLWEFLNPGPEEMMLAYGGVWFKAAPDAEMAYRGLVDEGSLRNARSVTNSYKNLIVRDRYEPPSSNPARLHWADLGDERPSVQEIPTAITARYRREGKGRKPTSAVFIPGFPPEEARPWLEHRLGPLAEFGATLTPPTAATG